MSNPNGGAEAPGSATTIPAELMCGLIMPISALDGCSAEHWSEVQSIIIDAVDSIAEPRFVPRLVSDADDVGVIQKRIIQNVYNSTIVICDVSGKNPNVMFELGLRLAFDKPTVIVKDDKTGYSFDTGVIEHLEYPRDLRFTKIVDFKRKLADKVLNTHKAAVADPNHSPFLKSFGQFLVASLNQTETSPDKVILEVLAEIQRDMHLLRERAYTERRLSRREEMEKFIRDEMLRNAPDGKTISLASINIRDLAQSVQRRFGEAYKREFLLGMVSQMLLTQQLEVATQVETPLTS
jgi:hypothetical protein